MNLEASNKCANILKGDEDGHIQSSLTIKSYIIMTHELNLISGVSPNAKYCLSMACYHILCLYTVPPWLNMEQKALLNLAIPGQSVFFTRNTGEHIICLMLLCSALTLHRFRDIETTLDHYRGP